MKALKAFIKPFEATQRSCENFSSFGIGTGRVERTSDLKRLHSKHFVVVLDYWSSLHSILDFVIENLTTY